jgi:hypothetical protein
LINHGLLAGGIQRRQRFRSAGRQKEAGIAQFE